MDLENTSIDELCNNVNNLTKKDNKLEFIKSYVKYKEELEQVDKFLKNGSEINSELTIQELFNMIQEYENNLAKEMSISKFKRLKDIIELLELKLSTEEIEVTSH
jgi:hypothetical protein